MPSGHQIILSIYNLSSFVKSHLTFPQKKNIAELAKAVVDKTLQFDNH
jgi:hypothetical protein